MKKKEFLTESKREKAIIESFAKTFNKIKRLHENEVSGKAEQSPLESKGIIEKIISDWKGVVLSFGDYEYTVNSRKSITIDCTAFLGDSDWTSQKDDYNVKFDIKYDLKEYGKYRPETRLQPAEYPEVDYNFTLDLVNVYNMESNDLVYKGRDEFLGVYKKYIISWMENNEKLLEEISEWYDESDREPDIDDEGYLEKSKRYK